MGEDERGTPSYGAHGYVKGERNIQIRGGARLREDERGLPSYGAHGYVKGERGTSSYVGAHG